MEKETDDFKIVGGKKLHGTIETNTSKNGALGLFCASLLNKQPTTLHGIPRIEEISSIIKIFESIGVKIEWSAKNTVIITPPKKFTLEKIDTNASSRIRSILMMIGALIHHEKNFQIPHAGGCKMGQRTITAHKYGLEMLGVKIKTKESSYEINREKLKTNDIVLYEASDTATENLLIASALIPGVTTLRFTPPNYQVQEVCFFLEKCGVKIEGIGTSTLVVHGVKEINAPTEYCNSEDPTESMTFISAAIVTNSKLTITRCPIDFLSLELLKLKIMGLKYKKSKIYFSKNDRTRLCDITVYPSKLIALNDKLHASAYPGINTDNLPFFVPIATTAKGTMLIHDWMWENRAIYFTEINKLEADIVLADQHRVFINGPTELKGNEIVCPPALRPAMIILVAMLGAKGQSILRNVYSINRGYEDIAKRLNAIGTDITLLDN
ncbi:MAG: UDP-N-acetylglucosamine 1-carboxyvinyltransferase [Parcubacteria group bacterium GW2011_GWF2_39_8b]|uniref:UDP-N-acetylglucosamine 1-carboxyvinyltransferase n=3 Tax=Candidatus Zambryskiibacteriota TaxID=1817925 RepID=A0A1G2T6F8_9BACT|nr:MAG: UDP-N-acetylglucosamine 1-carboxyvinyltransferase [Parcubacteria group bacterium GW2011_GWF2_39_8b]KKR45633.1 MAG: UDP-N-acetylglucosamine 1-carboxyvinyltransferase [Parcubacteria group bacterium GW2011_GWA2_40_14]OHA92867.1 MAG: UDP-N-acetylglucosamine 1-carboxyvinyltransferase [Candidatus Zambryskibacteria bacterium RIFCSPHIGHO2_02_38_10.5]OHA98251.1 MAG: UDP-N-acetylglucosamine 1-carboxyvinyltransferase [Candidatus Zambryskibacteria bacterium RIFCSPHIGHO2_12_FULL_38_37]OHB08638.1 MAG